MVHRFKTETYVKNFKNPDIKINKDSEPAQIEFATRLKKYTSTVNLKNVNEITETNNLVSNLLKKVNNPDDLKKFNDDYIKKKNHFNTVSNWKISTLKLKQLELAKRNMEKSEKRLRDTQNMIDLYNRFKPIVEGIINMEKFWQTNIIQSCIDAENSYESNVTRFSKHNNLIKDAIESFKIVENLKENYIKRKSHFDKVSNWQPSRIKFKQLNDALEKKNTAEAKSNKAQKDIKDIEDLYGKDYFEGLRVYFRGAGFIVSPSYLPPSAIFPADDWIKVKSIKDLSNTDLVKRADHLMIKHSILGTPYKGILYRSPLHGGDDKIGCVCVSWTVINSMSQENDLFYVPVLGFSGKTIKTPNNDNYDLEAALGACALPPFLDEEGKVFDPKINPQIKISNGSSIYTKYYDDIIVRANNLAVNYRVRKKLKMRLPSRQAMLSYLGLNFNNAVQLNDKYDIVNDKEQIKYRLSNTSPSIARWHSLNCAEPTALGWISSFFSDGQDVVLCCPYEGSDLPGLKGLKPKETCPWCATVELAYRSLKKVNSSDEWKNTFAKGMSKGEWDSEITVSSEFTNSASDLKKRHNLPRNKENFDIAYPSLVNENVSILREIFKELGLLTSTTIRVLEKPEWAI